MNAAAAKLAGARLVATADRPYLALALHALTVVESPGLGTFAVDAHGRLYVDPAVVEEWSVPEVAGVLVHEVWHVLRDHVDRADRIGLDHADAGAWNWATDAEINDDLEDLILPPGAVQPDSFGAPPHLSAEEYFALLRAYSEAGPGGDCGSGADGAPRPWDLGAPTTAEAGTDAACGLDAVDLDLLRRRTGAAVAAAAQGAPGRVPDSVLRWAETYQPSPTDWRQLLRCAVRPATPFGPGCSDYTRSRPSRRAAVLPGVVLPGLRRPVPTLAVVVDTSGSMGAAQLGAAVAEVEGILRATGRTTVLACDAAVQATTRVSRASAVELAGGGGTDMGAGIAAACRLRPRPSVIVVITDGMTPWPAQPPAGVHVVICLVGSAPVEAPAWARTVRVTS